MQGLSSKSFWRKGLKGKPVITGKRADFQHYTDSPFILSCIPVPKKKNSDAFHRGYESRPSQVTGDQVPN